MIIQTLLLASSLLFVQDSPVDIAKGDLPAKAVCVVCSSGGEEHGEEKPAAGVRYKGKSYFFCNKGEVATFKKDPEGFMPPVLPRPAPVMKATTLDGKTVTLADYRGNVVLVDFWATWCAPCVKSMPALDKFYAAHKDKGVELLGVSIDEEPKKVAPFLAKRKVSYPILLDDAKTPTWSSFKVRSVPMLFLIDREGQIVAQWSGEPKMKEVEAAVLKAIGS